jgi:hypothetical protein
MSRSLSFVRAVAFSSLSLVACGGGSITPGASPSHGIDPSRAITSLTATEVETICADTIKRLGGENHTVSCGDDRQFRAGTVETCKSTIVALSKAKQCDITVGELDACSVAQSKNVCADHEECDALNAQAAACR